MTWKYKQKDNEVTDSIGLLISILVRYPEVGTINYDPRTQVLKFTFIFSTKLDEKEINNFNKLILEGIETYNLLEGKKATKTEVHFQFCDNFTLLEICRDVNTLTKEELSLIVELVHDYFSQDLITETNDYIMEEDLLMQEELIEHMLENLKTSTQEKNLIAFREDGRVVVFNK